MSKYQCIEIEDIEVYGGLGSGGNGQVFKGRWHGKEGKGRMVAIKQLTAQYGETVDILCREAEIAYQSPSASICQVYGVCVLDSSSVWIVMELHSKQDLLSFLRTQTAPLPLSRKKFFCWQAAMAVHYLHLPQGEEPPILHRDIKSDNFFVRSPGNTISLGDFGRAITVNDGGKSVGTLRWTPPEILRRAEWTTASDIFALGLVFYHIVTGHLPFGDDTDEATVAEHILAGEIPEIPADCPTELRTLIELCLDQDPLKRPSSLEIWPLLQPEDYKILSIPDIPNEILLKKPMNKGLQEINPATIDELIDNEGNTLLHEAVYCGMLDKVEELIKLGADVNSCNFRNYTPLMAAAGRDWNIVQLLLENGAQVDLQATDGSTALTIACRYGLRESVQAILDNNPNMNILDERHRTPLSYAIRSGNMECVRLLVAHGAELEACEKARSALDVAISTNHNNIIDELVAKQDSLVQPALMHSAAHHNNKDAVLKLLALGVDINGTDKKGCTSLMTAAHAGNADMLSMLVEHGAAIDAQDGDGWTALLFWAVKGQQASCVAELIKLGASWEVRDCEGFRAIIYASFSRQPLLIETVILNWPNPAHSDFGRALYLALEQKNDVAFNLFYQYTQIMYLGYV